MKLTESQLRSIIRDVISECYGWPVERTQDIYPGAKKSHVKHTSDPKNRNLKMPKGPNTRMGLKESFQRITSKELAAWSAGNYDEINEDVNYDPCEGCGEMFPATSMNVDESGKYLCGSCYGVDRT